MKVRIFLWWRRHFTRKPLYEANGLTEAPRHKPRIFGIRLPSDYNMDFCPVCRKEQVVYSKGLTACHECGKTLFPCRSCGGCDYEDCVYDGIKTATNPPITEAEIRWYKRINDRQVARYNKKYAKMHKLPPFGVDELPF